MNSPENSVKKKPKSTIGGLVDRRRTKPRQKTKRGAINNKTIFKSLPNFLNKTIINREKKSNNKRIAKT